MLHSVKGAVGTHGFSHVGGLNQSADMKNQQKSKTKQLVSFHSISTKGGLGYFQTNMLLLLRLCRKLYDYSVRIYRQHGTHKRSDVLETLKAELDAPDNSSEIRMDRRCSAWVAAEIRCVAQFAAAVCVYQCLCVGCWCFGEPL